MADNSNIEESPLKSKKFISFIVSEFFWKILAGLVLFYGKDSMGDSTFFIMLAIIFVAGFVEVGFILGQASLDKFIRLAKIAADSGVKVFPQMKGMVIQKDETPVKPG